MRKVLLMLLVAALLITGGSLQWLQEPEADYPGGGRGIH